MYKKSETMLPNPHDQQHVNVYNRKLNISYIWLYSVHVFPGVYVYFERNPKKKLCVIFYIELLIL